MLYGEEKIEFEGIDAQENRYYISKREGSSHELPTLKYSNNNLAKFIEEYKIIKPYTENIKYGSYIEITKWLIQLSNNIDYLFILWNDILLHNNEIDNRLFKEYQQLIDIVCLKFSDLIPYFYLKIWTKENITAITNLLHNNGLYWAREDAILSLDLISQSNTLELLNIFPEILDGWLCNDFSDKKERYQKFVDSKQRNKQVNTTQKNSLSVAKQDTHYLRLQNKQESKRS
ncbi:hypothetical protein C1646_762275 [Rhizophagus diaphanus]|nr:hypothetical protein C1646_762275 [Rhizophagus diaphanus] [Rhizophagus sp. MUCL 43196]